MGKIVAFVIGTHKDCAYKLYCKAKQAVGSIDRIYTDSNSCYREAFSFYNVPVEHIIAPFKTQTHLIESTNSSLRDNLARFNRITKRYTKSLEMLKHTLTLFCHFKQFRVNSTS